MPQPSLDVNAVLQGEKNVHHTFLVIVCVQQPSACQRARSEPVRNGSSKHIGDRVQLMLGQRSGYPSHLERNIVKPAWSEARSVPSVWKVKATLEVAIPEITLVA